VSASRDAIVVVSPHLDDAILSIGAFIAGSASRGARVTVLTVLAGNPRSQAPAGPWDSACGFSTAGDAARARREEDRRACALVGARPQWLPFGDDQYGLGADVADVRGEVERSLAGAQTVLVPGHPLWHEDHRWLTRLVLGGVGEVVRAGCYVELPYARWQLPERPPPDFSLGPLTWHSVASRPRDRLSKARACLAYRSQLRQLSRSPWRSVLLEALRSTGERVAWL
jgi:LmbE family N-acetylglucosaminyl deacetylase